MNIRSKIFGGDKPDRRSPLLGSKRPRGAKTDALDSVSVPRDGGRTSNTRHGDRHRLPQAQASVVHQGRTVAVTLINVSGGGAMVEGEFEPKLWDRLDLKLAEDGVIECAVRWLRGNRVGLEFAHETQIDCSPDEQAILLRDVIARSFKDVEYGSEPAAPFAAAPDAELRRERRHPLIWTGVLHHDFESAPVRLRNISSSGALIDCQVPPPVGAEPLLDLGDAGSVFATVNWVLGDQVGLRFHAPFDLSQLAKARPEIAPVKWERPAYLDAAATADSPWAVQWDRMALDELRDQLDGFMKR